MSQAKGYHHVLLEALNNVLTVQAYTMEPFERQRFRDCTSDMMRIGMRHAFYQALANPITEMLGIGMVATSIAVGAWLVINQETQIFGITMTDQPMTVPGIMIFFGFLIGASDPVRKLSGVITGLNMGIVGAQGLYPLLDTDSKLAEAAEPKRLAVAPPGDPPGRRLVFLRRHRHGARQTSTSRSRSASGWRSWGPTAAARAR